MKRESEKLYIIRKFVRAPSVKEAIEREPSTPVAEVFIDESKNEKAHSDAIGFHYVYVDEE